MAAAPLLWEFCCGFRGGGCDKEMDMTLDKQGTYLPGHAATKTAGRTNLRLFAVSGQKRPLLHACIKLRGGHVK